MRTPKDRSDRPSILIVDDHADQESPVQGHLENEGVRAMVVHPGDVVVDDLAEADLLLVDFVLDAWEERAGLSPGLQPQNGAALIAVFRSHLEVDLEAETHPTAFALRTGRFSSIPSLFPQPVTRHAYARANNFEWVFDKADEKAIPQAAELARAVRSLPSEWVVNDEDPLGPARALLKLSSDSYWAVTAEQDILACHPPLHEISTVSDGLAFLRWLLHRILPYPCFLYDRNRVSARLGVSRRTLDGLLAAGSPHAGLGELLAPARYAGVLAGFLDERWWGAGVERVLWEATEGRPFAATTLRSLVNAMTPTAIDEPILQFPVMPIDNEYAFLAEPVEMDAAVEVRPDDWPPFAEQAWTTPEVLATSTRLRNVVVSERDGTRETG